MDFTMTELVDLVEICSTRATYLRKMAEPEMGLQPDLVRDAVDELVRVADLRVRFMEEIVRLRVK